MQQNQHTSEGQLRAEQALSEKASPAYFGFGFKSAAPQLLALRSFNSSPKNLSTDEARFPFSIRLLLSHRLCLPFILISFVVHRPHSIPSQSPVLPLLRIASCNQAGAITAPFFFLDLNPSAPSSRFSSNNFISSDGRINPLLCQHDWQRETATHRDDLLIIDNTSTRPLFPGNVTTFSHGR